MTYIIIGFIVLIVILAIKPKEQENTYFGNINDITSRFNKGYSLSGNLKATTRDVAYKNCLVIGPSGSGKTSSVLVGSLFCLARGNSSICILDLSKEIYKLVSGYLSKFFKIYCFDLSEFSDGFNPLALCNTVSDIQKIAQLLIKNSGTESKSDPYWSASAQLILQTFIQYVVFYAKPEERHMGSVVKMLELFAGQPKKIDLLIVRANDIELLDTYRSIIAVGDKTLQSSISSALVAVKVFKNPDVMRCTSINTIDFTKFRSEKSILFICTPITEINFLAPVSALMFEALFNEIMSRIPEPSENSVYCIIDEMITMRFQNLGLVYSNIRKFRGSCMGLIQDERMLEISYSAAESHAIKSNAYSKIYLKGQPHETCKRLQDMIGTTENNKPVMTAADIRTSDEAIIIVGDNKPYSVQMTHYFEHWLLRRRTRIAPYIQKNKIPFLKPPIIKID